MDEFPWWRAFFGEPWSKIQAGGYPAERTAAECDLIERLLELSAGAQLVDIPCGVGRHSVELAQRGYRVTGVEYNADYLAQARASALQAGVEVRLLQGDMRDFSAVEEFDAAFCYFGSFGYFGEGDNRKFAQAVLRSLRRGGRFLIDTHLAETLFPIHQQREWFWAGAPERGVRVTEERRFDVNTGRMEVTWTIIDPSGTQSSHGSMRIYSYRELRELLGRAGFASVQVFCGASGGAFRLGAPRAIVVARRD